MTSAREDVAAARAGGPVAPRDRSIVPTILGLRWWGALILALVLTLVGVGVDLVMAGALGVVFLVCYPVGCVLATAWARRGELFAPMVQPPLLLLVAIPVVVLVAGRLPASSGLVAKVLAVAGPFINGFPAMGITTVVCIGLGIARIRLQPVDDAGAPPDGERERGGRPRDPERERPAERDQAAERERSTDRLTKRERAAERDQAAERERSTDRLTTRERAADRERSTDRLTKRDRAAERDRVGGRERCTERGGERPSGRGRDRGTEQDHAGERGPAGRDRPDDAADRRSPRGAGAEPTERKQATERERPTKDEARGQRPGYRRGEGARDREALAKGAIDPEPPERDPQDRPPRDERRGGPPPSGTGRDRMREERLRAERRDGPGDDRRRGRPEPPRRPGPPPKPGPPGVRPPPRRPDDPGRG